MNCQKFESVASELARGQIIEADVRGEALVHSAGCSSCASRLRNEEMLTVGLRSLVREMNSSEPSVSIETRLLNAFRQSQVVAPMSAARNHSRYWLAAVAALLLIVLSVIAVRWRGDGVQSPKEQFAVNPTGEVHKANITTGDPAPGPSSEREGADKPRSKPRPRRTLSNSALQARAGTARKDNNVVANHVNNEIATEFMPLGYLNVAALQDGGQIVRVELPRTALANFGLPVNMDRYNEKVKADVLLGVDGMAHAIRFVQEKRLQ
jgi:hypothetical protein